MTILASLTNRIFLASAALAVVTVALAVYLVSASVTRETETALSRDLVESAALVDQQRSALARQYALVARLVADLPRLKGAIDTEDPITVAPIVDDYQRRLQLDADLLLITDRHGGRLAGPADVTTSRSLPTVAGALAGHEGAAFWPDRRGIMQVVTVPVYVERPEPEVLGTLTAGFLLDDQRAEQLKRATGSDIAFAMNGRIVAATLPPDVRGAMSTIAPAPGVSYVRLGAEDYAVTGLSLRLKDGAADPHAPSVLVLRSRTSQLRGLRPINVALLTTAVLAIVLATILSYAVARSVTRPLGTITATMREVAATGDLTRKIHLPGPSWWQDEDARLVAATFNNLTESVARVQRETAQRDRLLALGRLSTVVAHEVRNPLMIIKGALRSLRPGLPDAEQREAVGDIDEQVGRLNRIVHDVLDFARPLHFDLAPTDLGRLCSEAATAVQASEPGGPSITIRTEPLEIVTDGERLRAALINLLANARQAVTARRREAEQEGTPLSPAVDDVVIETGARGSYAQVTISDRGGGIAADHVAQIFEPYFTTKRSGTGLGLPIARNIVEGLGGIIAVQCRHAGDDSRSRPAASAAGNFPAAE